MSKNYIEIRCDDIDYLTRIKKELEKGKLLAFLNPPKIYPNYTVTEEIEDVENIVLEGNTLSFYYYAGCMLLPLTLSTLHEKNCEWWYAYLDLRRDLGQILTREKHQEKTQVCSIDSVRKGKLPQKFVDVFDLSINLTNKSTS